MTYLIWWGALTVFCIVIAILAGGYAEYSGRPPDLAPKFWKVALVCVAIAFVITALGSTVVGWF